MKVNLNIPRHRVISISVVGARRVDVTEEHAIFKATTVFFRAGTPSAGASGSQVWNHASNRRTASVGPGLVLDIEEDEHEPDSSNGQPSRASPPPNILSRRVSMDHHNLQSHYVSHHVGTAHTRALTIEGPTPPYSPSPTMTHRADSWMSSGSGPMVSPGIAEVDEREDIVHGIDVVQSPGASWLGDRAVLKFTQ